MESKEVSSLQIPKKSPTLSRILNDSTIPSIAIHTGGGKESSCSTVYSENHSPKPCAFDLVNKYDRMSHEINSDDPKCAMNHITLQFSSKAMEIAYLQHQHDHKSLRSLFPACQALVLLFIDLVLAKKTVATFRWGLGSTIILLSVIGSIFIKTRKERFHLFRSCFLSEHDIYLFVSCSCEIVLLLWVVWTAHRYETSGSTSSETCALSWSYWQMEVFSTAFFSIIFMKPPFILTVIIHVLVLLAVTSRGFRMPEGIAWCISNKVLIYFYLASSLTFLYLAELSNKRHFARWIMTIDSLDVAKSEAENANRAKRDFLSYIFHEIRVPLSAISIAVDLLAQQKATYVSTEAIQDKEPEKEEGESLVLMIRQQVDTVRHILDDVLSLQKIEEGKFGVEKAPFCISKMLTEVHWAYEKICSQNNVKISLEIPADLVDVKVNGDQYRLRQVLANFVSNALKFAPSVGGSVKIAAQEVKTMSGTMLEISVRDNGVGISIEDQQKLFRPYVQISAGELQKGRGTGLGLNISKHIIRLHEGTIGVRSLEKLGSKFFFQIPFVRVRVPSIPKPQVSPPALDASQPISITSETKEDLDKTMSSIPDQSQTSHSAQVSASTNVEDKLKLLRVLVVEDNAANSKLLKRMLTTWGVTVTQAFNGLEAVAIVAMCHPNDPPFDLILMDKEMPIMQGDEAIRQIRSLGFKLPIVVLSGNGFEEEKENMMQCGADAFLTKPVSAAELKTGIQKYAIETPLELLIERRKGRQSPPRRTQ
jgi:signal transduction histidine kinase/CheY-like chemotaxis protein